MPGSAGISLPGGGGIGLIGQLKPVIAPGLPDHTRALSLFVVNRRATAPEGRSDESFIFQVSLALDATHGFIPRPAGPLWFRLRRVGL